jgi:hypothetical protein
MKKTNKELVVENVLEQIYIGFYTGLPAMFNSPFNIELLNDYICESHIAAGCVRRNLMWSNS